MTKYSLATAFDKHYAEYATVMLRSLEKSLTFPIDVYCLVPTVDQDHPGVTRLRDAFLGSDRLNVVILAVAEFEKWKSDLSLKSETHVSVATFLRLFLDLVIPDDVDTIVYIDADAIILRDPSPLFMMEITSPIHAIQDMGSAGFQLFGSHDSLYFNAGVFKASLKEWRSAGLREFCFNHIQKNGQSRHLDQDLLNLFFRDKAGSMPMTFNTFAHLWTVRRFIPFIESPVVVHFAGSIKPWNVAGSEDPWIIAWREIYEREFLRPVEWEPGAQAIIGSVEESRLWRRIARFFPKVVKASVRQAIIASFPLLNRLFDHLPGRFGRWAKRALDDGLRKSAERRHRAYWSEIGPGGDSEA